jgi:uncharacterized membrane protein YdjX (TVP38/TMEM64 family)
MWRRVGLGLVLVAVVAVVVFLLRDGMPGIPDLRQAVAAAGMWGPLVFVALHAVVSASPVPRTVFTVAAGVLFGSLIGLAAALAGTALAAGLSFVLARFVGGPLAERYAHLPAVSWVRRRVQHRGLLTMISLRLIPAMPFSVMNYGAALSGARIAPYLLATLVGVLPGTISIVVLGDAAVGGNPHPAMFVVSVVSGLIGLTGAALVARRPLPEPVPAAGPVERVDRDAGDIGRAA